MLLQEKFWERLQELSGPQYDLEPLDMSEKKFNAQSRLFVGSLPRESTLEELKEMFGKYGELGQVYFNKDGAYAFINFDYHVNAEKAMRELNGTPIRGRSIKVRFAAITTGVRVKNLTANVTNELLCKAFSVFGAVEQSRVIVDDRGKPTGDGTIIFTEKKSAVMAYKKCQEESFFLTNQLRPVIVEPWENRDEEEGYPEAGLVKNEQYKKDRKVGPRFAEPNSIESEYGKQWKQLFDLYKEKRLSLESDLKAEMDALEVKMQLVVHQQETEKLRKELAQREQEALQLQMGLGSFREGGRPTQLSGEEFGSSYGKRPQDYYDVPGEHRTPYDQPRPYDEYYHQRSGYDRPEDRPGYNGRGQVGYESRPAGYEGRSQSYDSRTTSGFDSRSQAYDSRPPAAYDARGGRSGGYDSASHGGYPYDHTSTSPYDQPPSKPGPPPSQLPPPIPAAATGGGYDAPVAPTSAVAPAVAAAASAAPPPSESVPGSTSDGYSASASAYGRTSASATAGSYGRAPTVGSSSSSGYGRSSSGAATGYDRTPTASGQGYDVGQQGSSPYENSNKRSRY
ncbi:RNA recognition motif domain [Trinorchestia longiramus]|nr:RNA recognition motif domain [Trinorchestia longiramus]